MLILKEELYKVRRTVYCISKVVEIWEQKTMNLFLFQSEATMKVILANNNCKDQNNTTHLLEARSN